MITGTKPAPYVIQVVRLYRYLNEISVDTFMGDDGWITANKSFNSGTRKPCYLVASYPNQSVILSRK